MMAESLIADLDLSSLKPIIEEFWRAWFIGGSNPGEGRELGNPSRIFSKDPSELPLWIALNEAKRLPSYMGIAVYSERDSPAAIDRLFYDFDSKDDLEVAWRDTQTLAQALERRYGCQPLIAFSGSKGFHIYAFLEKPYRGSRLREVYAELQAMTLRGLSLQTLDRAVIGDVKRLSRIPYTLHEKSGTLCIPVDHRGRPILIDASTLCALRHRGIPWGVVEIALSHIEERAQAEGVRRTRSGCGFKSHRPRLQGEWEPRPRPCIEAALHKSLDGEKGHLMRLAILREYQALGWGKHSIAQLYRFQSDYGDGSEALRHVEANWRRDVKPFRCETIMELGYCLGPECPLYRRRWRWVRSLQG